MLKKRAPDRYKQSISRTRTAKVVFIALYEEDLKKRTNGDRMARLKKRCKEKIHGTQRREEEQ